MTKHMITEQVGDFRRHVQMLPAFDRRSTEPSKDYGVHGVEIHFTLVGPLGAAQFTLYSGFMTKNLRDERPEERRKAHFLPADVGIHSPAPLHEGQVGQECCYLGGKTCYSDGSGLAAADAFDALTDGGLDGVWQYLERRYAQQFSPETASAGNT